MKYFFYKSVFLLAFHWVSFAQEIMVNTDQVISVQKNTLMSVHGPLWNQTQGYFLNQGQILLKDSLINDNPDSCFKQTNPGSVTLFGSEQHITGTQPIRFDSLILAGTATKFVHLNIYIDRFLDLKDRRLSTTRDTTFLRNPVANSLARTSGFISSDLGGTFVRYTRSTATYLFPVGDSLPVFRYRPVEIIPATANNAQFAVRFVNADPTSEGFDRTLKDSSICVVNPDYFHRINSLSATTATLNIHYENTDDVRKGVAQWDKFSSPAYQWNNKTLQATDGGSFWQLPAWNRFDSEAFAFVGVKPEVFISVLPDDSLLCEGDTMQLSATDNPDWIYNWSNGQTGNPIFITQGGTYYVTVTDTSLPVSCPVNSQDTINIQFIADFTASLSTPDSIICEGTSTILYANPDSNSYSYTWYESGTLLQGENQSSLNVSTEGFYYVEISNICFTRLSPTYYIVVLRNTMADFTYSPDTILLLEPAEFTSTSVSDSGNPIVSYTWSINEIPSYFSSTFTHTFQQADSFLITLVIDTEEGCRDTVRKRIKVHNVRKLFVPSAFTPNGDGLNDVFSIYGVGLERWDMFIYNRWGELVWNGTNEFWNGESRTGKPVQEDAYVFVIKAVFKDKTQVVRSGTVQVLR